jgi:hypothetical protein
VGSRSFKMNAIRMFHGIIIVDDVTRLFMEIIGLLQIVHTHMYT